MKEDFEDKKEKKQIEFSKEEFLNARKELGKFKQQERTYTKPSGATYTKLITTMEQYMEVLGVIRFDSVGLKIVRDPEGYDRLSRLESVLDNWDFKKMQELFETNPEARKAHLDYVTEIGNTVRGLGDKFKI